MKSFGVRLGFVIMALFLFASGPTSSEALAFNLFKNSPLEEVKGGVLKNYKSTTVGKAFDNYAYFTSTHWEEFESHQGQKVVQFDADLDVTACLKKLEPYGELIYMMSETPNGMNEMKTDKNLQARYANYALKLKEFTDRGLEVTGNIENANVENKLFEMLALKPSDDKMGEASLKTANYLLNGNFGKDYKTTFTVQFLVNVDNTFEIAYVGVEVNGKEYRYDYSNDIDNIYNNNPLDITFGIGYIAYWDKFIEYCK